MSPISKILIATLAAVGSAQAYPQQSGYGQQPSSTLSTMVASASSTGSAAPPAATPDNTKLFQDLFTAPTAVRRFQKLLTAAGQKLLTGADLAKIVVFDFNNNAPANKGGKAVAANIETFPILTDLGISTTVGFLEACGMNTPHIHPRATEFLTLVDGKIDFGYILENNFLPAGQNPEVTGSLTKFQGTVFPMGSIHYQVNTECQPATFVATLNHEDPGTSQMAQNFFGLNKDVVNATLGFPGTVAGKDIESFRKTIPANIALGIDACLNRCGIHPNAAN